MLPMATMDIDIINKHLEQKRNILYGIIDIFAVVIYYSFCSVVVFVKGVCVSFPYLFFFFFKWENLVTKSRNN